MLKMNTPVFFYPPALATLRPMGETVLRLDRRSETTNAAASRAGIADGFAGNKLHPEGSRGDRIRTATSCPKQALRQAELHPEIFFFG